MSKPQFLVAACACMLMLATAATSSVSQASTPPPSNIQDGSFEPPGAPDASAGDVGSCFPGSFGAWNFFNCNYVTSNLYRPGGDFKNPSAHDGTQVLKQFGEDAGVFQDITSSPGATVEASAYAISWDGDAFNNIGLLQIFFLDSDGNNISGGFNPAAQVAAGSDVIVGGEFDYVLSPQDGGELSDWTLMEVSAVAPAGTASARIQMIHILEASTPSLGALFWDDASLTSTPPPSVQDTFPWEIFMPSILHRPDEGTP